MAMVRKQIYITADDDRRLKAEARRRGISEAAIIRERLDARTAVLRPEYAAADYTRMMRGFEKIRRAAKTKRESTTRFDRSEAYAERLERQSPR